MAIHSVGGTGSPVVPNLPEQPARSAEAAPDQVRPQPAAAAPPPQQAVPSQEQVQQAVMEVQKMVQSKASNLQFSIDQESGKTVIKLLDSQTGDLIRQIPSEEMLAISHSLDKMQGLLFKQKA